MNEKPFGNMPSDPGVRELVAACLNRSATDEQWRRLNSLIAEHREVADFWASHAAMHRRLSRVMNPEFQAVRGAAVAGKNPGACQVLPLAGMSRPNAASAIFTRRYGWLIAGSVALVLLVFAARSQVPRSFSPRVAIAWIDGQNPARDLRAGERVRQNNGQTAIRFESGVRLTLSGDADLELISAMAVRLHSGQLQADVGETGRGFRVLTDSADVVDLGTVFGVGVNSAGETDVVVFQGEVELNQHEGRPQQLADRRFTTGEAVRVEAGGNPTRIPVIWQGSAGAPWSTAADLGGSSVIASVGDNLSSVSRPKFYGVVSGGFRDGVKAYGDRTHVWSGVGDEHLPAELLDGDYIQTFHDDRAETDFEIRLKVVIPAKIYVFIDDRVRAPDWVLRDFTDTGRRVALSVKHTGGPNPRYAEGRPHPLYGGTLYEGYFQFPFSVWVREVEAERDLRLGPPSTLYQGEISWSGMYGIVAVPNGKDR